jgi:ABC-type dipeptide/oligopeptide/nickel transport system permease subunit
MMRWPRFVRTPQGVVGLAMLAFVLLVAFVGPLIAPHSIEEPIGAPGQSPGAGALLGTDFLGRDVLSRVLHGGVSVLGLSITATVLTYIVGITVGLIAGYSRSLVDPLLMRFVDLMLSFPALLLLLVLVTGAGSGVGILILGVVLVMFPGVARIVRTSTLEASVKGYVEAAVMRGERPSAILTREILPNIISFVLADVGIRFSAAIIFIASLNYLSLGLKPPAADWALMIAENREILSSNVWGVLAPAIMLGLLTISVNLLGDAYARTLGRSRGRA